MDSNEREAFIAYAQMPAFKRKVERSLEVIREALAISPAYVSVSWGKDSVVMLHLCQQARPDIEAIHIGHDHQELIDNYQEVVANYCARFPTNHQWIKGDQANAKQGIASLDLYEKYPVAFIGLRSEESKVRAKSLGRNGMIYQYANGSYRCAPLAYWTWKDIWAYTVSENLPYLASYDHKMNHDRRHSRTAVHYSSGRGSGFGRLSKIQAISPDYYKLLKQQIPELS